MTFRVPYFFPNLTQQTGPLLKQERRDSGGSQQRFSHLTSSLNDNARRAKVPDHLEMAVPLTLVPKRSRTPRNPPMSTRIALPTKLVDLCKEKGPTILQLRDRARPTSFATSIELSRILAQIALLLNWANSRSPAANQLRLPCMYYLC